MEGMKDRLDRCRSEPFRVRGMPVGLTTLLLAVVLLPTGANGQESTRLFPDPGLMPNLLGGPRDPETSASLYYVATNPNSFGPGVEAEVSLGHALPILALGGTPSATSVLVGIEAAVFARFGFQRTERELIDSDWIFAVPIYWHRPRGWVRLRYFHTSSHMGDEYSRRFEEIGTNFSRDAVELLAFRNLSSNLGVYGGARYAYNVHPESGARWVLRGGSQLEAEEKGGLLRPFTALDLEWDQDAGGTRIEGRVGAWLPPVRERRNISLALTVLTGPSPMGQFSGESSTQVGLGIQGFF